MRHRCAPERADIRTQLDQLYITPLDGIDLSRFARLIPAEFGAGRSY
jgi:hypothetical protein